MYASKVDEEGETNLVSEASKQAIRAGGMTRVVIGCCDLQRQRHSSLPK
jgi:hypothetical protein